MKKFILLAILCASSVVMTGCGILPLKGTMSAAITLDHIASDPIVDNSVRPIKRGEATCTGIVLYATGDGSIRAAMRNGRITKVHHVDYSVKNILYLYTETTTIVYGE